MIRRGGGAPPDHPLDTPDTGRDQITEPEKKNGDRDHSAKNRIATAVAPTGTIERTAP